MTVFFFSSSQLTTFLVLLFFFGSTSGRSLVISMFFFFLFPRLSSSVWPQNRKQGNGVSHSFAFLYLLRASTCISVFFFFSHHLSIFVSRWVFYVLDASSAGREKKAKNEFFLELTKKQLRTERRREKMLRVMRSFFASVSWLLFCFLLSVRIAFPFCEKRCRRKKNTKGKERSFL